MFLTTKLLIKRIEEAVTLLNREGEIFIHQTNTKVKVPVFSNVIIFSFIEKENKIIDTFELEKSKIKKIK